MQQNFMFLCMFPLLSTVKWCLRGDMEQSMHYREELYIIVLYIRITRLACYANVQLNIFYLDNSIHLCELMLFLIFKLCSYSYFSVNHFCIVLM